MNNVFDKLPVHPGKYIRESILPSGLTVTEAAERLGVGRPALSNLLNGKAALSPEMAMRIEKTFQADATRLLGMQVQYDESQARIHEDEIVVRTYIPGFLQIPARQIAMWAEEHNARAELAALLRTLVHSTGKDLSLVDFPAFDNSQRPGWDGQVMSGVATPWIPRGQSGWEFGCGQNPRDKAERDYQKRTVGIPLKERQSTTFVFVTPRNWTGKDNWAKDKKKHSQWKDVRAYDASDLEQWLEQSPPAQIRMQEFLGIMDQGITSLEKIWLEWANVTEPRMPKALFGPAAAQHEKTLMDWLKVAPARPFIVTAESTLEALAFLCCSLERLSQQYPGAYERAVVVRSVDGFKALSRVSSNYIAIIASPEVEHALAGLQKKTHTLIVRERNKPTTQADIQIGLLDHFSFHNALKETGLDENRIKQLARESARSPTILRRRLATTQEIKVPPWAEDESVVRELIPFILVGAWDSSKKADRKVLRRLSGEKKYEKIEQQLARLQAKDQSPVWSVGNFHGIVSKIDAFFAVCRYFTKTDLENFLSIVKCILSEKDPALQLPEDRRWAAELNENSRDHSSVLRQGVCDSLVLLAVHGNDWVGERLGIDIESEVNGVIHRLLTPTTASTWLSQQAELPEYAEAAPDTFLDIVEATLASEDRNICVLVKPVHTGMFHQGERGSGLLWALELLAWKPERLMRVVCILAKLSQLTMDDIYRRDLIEKTLNSIFLYWSPQTAATFGQRIGVLKKLIKEFPDVGWRICLNHLDPVLAPAHPGYTPRWRTDAFNAGETIPRSEAEDDRLEVIEIALNWTSYDEHKLGDLVKCLVRLKPEQRKRVWGLIIDWNNSGPTDSQKVTLRDRIQRELRTWFSEIGDADRKCAQQAYAILEPQNPLARHQWLFRESSVLLLDNGLEEKNFHFEDIEKHIVYDRQVALREVWADSGFDGIKQLCRSGNAPGEVGKHMAKICTGVQQATSFVRDMLLEQSSDLREKCEKCIAGFMAELNPQDRDSVLLALLERLCSDDDACIRILCCAPFDKSTWPHVKKLDKRLKLRYWQEVNPGPSDMSVPEVVFFVHELLNVGRPHAAFHAAHIHWQHVDSALIILLLVNVATNNMEPSNDYPLDGVEVSKAFETLTQRGDTPQKKLALLEFLFIEALIYYKHGIPNMEAQLSKDPTMFMQALAFAFPRNDGKEDPPEWQKEQTDNKFDVVGKAKTLLKKTNRIPGMQSNGSIDYKELKTWLEQVRKLTRKYGRIEVGDKMIGQLLSRCSPGDDGVWPCEPVREIIEDVKSEAIRNGMIIGFLNARGAYWSSIGGIRESELAEQYRDWSLQLVIRYPQTSYILKKIASRYDREARESDWQESVYQRFEQ